MKIHIEDYDNFKIVIIVYLILLFLLINTNLLSYLFTNINKQQFNLFIVGYLMFGIVNLLICPIISIFLYKTSSENDLNKKKLYDILHNINLDETLMKYLIKINDIIPPIAIICYISLCLYYDNINALSYFIIGISLLFFMKYILNCSTILPDASQENRVKFLTGSCNTLLLSGHYSFILLIYLLITKYNMLNNNYNNYLLIFTILYAFIPIITRRHYTIDVLVSIISVLLINNYL
tara:strand:- start:35 stop:742 length:708 start_codon:yes stop_codon:yes gene_type:complete